MSRITSESQLQKILTAKIKEAVDLLVQKIWNENRELVRVVVYEAYLPKEYERTNEFKEAWNTTVESQGNMVKGKFQYDPKEMTVNYEKMQHGSPKKGPSTEYLADIIYQGLAGDFTGQTKYAKNNPIYNDEAWTKKRDAWEYLQKRLTRPILKKWMEECFAKVGLDVIPHGRSWGLIQW